MDQFDETLRKATANLKENYFQLPIAGSEKVTYRERVYCYELYHQMRVHWPKESMYSLCGEIDKGGHPLVRGNGLDNLKPDFLVHVPGTMDENYLVMEVKPGNCSSKGIAKDIETLNAFVQHANYQRAILLIYGTTLDNLSKRVQNELQRANGEVEIWTHNTCLFSASREG
ncbi:hypothetical protein [Idiomarina xiamenensis]|uniref:Methionyl-tRNA formyltransferase-like protein n=1 Tax=Idiomarina xiamenensis 10-D-4 TaxID=740709 RepID=K2K9Z4_9GAMM|nr:hypothetical protein [Idiomarina xiamenensis]EKE83332.1 methionyl-tRNA formyltransferase-like protein [Idiomarina xiamenensis 10-D-4]